MFKVLDYTIIVSVFELQSFFYVRFRTNPPGKIMNPFIPPPMKPNWYWTIRFLYSDHLRFHPWYNKLFVCFGEFMAQFEIVKLKFSNYTTLHVHQCIFHVKHCVKQCSTCQRTNYRYTTIQNEYLYLPSRLGQLNTLTACLQSDKISSQLVSWIWH